LKNIKVNLLNPTPYGRLYYKPDPQIEPNVYFLENNLKIRRGYSINIDSAIILDVGENLILQAAEFVIHKKKWKIDPRLEYPDPKIEADIQIVNLSNRNEVIEKYVHSIADDQYCYVSFRWEDKTSDEKWVSLSEHCYASISNQFLTSFFVKLTEAGVTSPVTAANCYRSYW
jgi:hypothetical protein